MDKKVKDAVPRIIPDLYHLQMLLLSEVMSSVGNYNSEATF